MADYDLRQYVARDLELQKGLYIPVHAKLLERIFVKKTAPANLHVNEEDLFTHPNVGPSDRFIARYVGQISRSKSNGGTALEPLLVEKLWPDGYRLLNGHHRWAAAMRVGLKKVPIKIINLASESDILKILERSQHDKRVTLDLDEVIFRPADDPYLEPAPRFPYKNTNGWRVRLGTPALFYYLARCGYDIWVYTADYYSIDEISGFFRAYSVNVDGIITGLAKQRENHSESAARMEKLIANKYSRTLHIDNDLILLTRKDTGEFEEYELNAPAEEWARSAITIIGRIEKNEEST